VDLKNLNLEIILKYKEAEDLTSDQKQILKQLKHISRLYFSIRSLSSFDSNKFVSLLKTNSHENILS
jgi:hypothetical protein